MPGRSEFKVKITRAAIREITEKVGCTDFFAVETLLKSGAPYEDIMTANVLCALHDFLRTSNCEPDFELVFHE